MEMVSQAQSTWEEGTWGEEMSVLTIYSRHPKEGYAIKVGTWIDGEAIFDCYPKHYFINRKAWGLDSDAFASLPASTKTIILDIHKNGTKRRLSVDFARFSAESWEYSFPGFSTRRFLEADKWEGADNQISLPGVETTPAPEHKASKAQRAHPLYGGE